MFLWRDPFALNIPRIDTEVMRQFPDRCSERRALDGKPEHFHQAAAANRRYGERAAVAHPLDPLKFEASTCQSRSDGAADMWPPFGPVQAWSAKNAAFCARD